MAIVWFLIGFAAAAALFLAQQALNSRKRKYEELVQDRDKKYLAEKLVYEDQISNLKLNILQLTKDTDVESMYRTASGFLSYRKAKQQAAVDDEE